jgi:hypothetical protein
MFFKQNPPCIPFKNKFIPFIPLSTTLRLKNAVKKTIDALNSLSEPIEQRQTQTLEGIADYFN